MLARCGEITSIHLIDSTVRRPRAAHAAGYAALRSVCYIAIVFVAILSPLALRAQEREVQPRPLLEEPTLHFRDKDGQLVPFPGLSLEELRKLIDLQKQIAQGATEPLYTLERMTATGTIGANTAPESEPTQEGEPQHNEQFAALTIELQARVHAEGWVRIPLRLGECILRGSPKFEGGGDQFLRFNDRRGGFDWWVSGPPGEYRCTLSTLVRLAREEGETRLQITAPKSAQPEMTLTIPGQQTAGTVLGAELIEEVRIQGETQFKLAGLDGLCSLSWRSQSERLVKSSSDLRVDGFLLCRIDGRSVRTEAMLNVSSFGGPFGAFSVRLPPDAKLVNDDPRFQIVPGSRNQASQVVRVLREPSPEPEVVTLVTERPVDAAKPADEIELMGFEVVGAVRQSGHIAIETADGWQAMWKRLVPAVRQIAVSDLPEEVPDGDFTAAFIYWRQPATLKTTILRRETRIRVDPVYRISVQPNRLMMEATLRYNVDGARVLNLPIDLSDWQVDEVGPDNLVDVENLRYDQVRPFLIPLTQATEGKLEITLRAHRPHDGQNGPVTFSVPRPEANVLNPAQVWVMPADNVSLLPRQEALLGLIRQQIPSDSLGGSRALYYRAEAPQAEFVADLLVHSRRVTVESDAHVSVGTRSSEVRQRLNYRVEYEPMAGAALVVPPGVDLQEVSLNGRKMDYVLLSSQDSSASLAHVVLPIESQLGTFQLVARYRFNHDPVGADRSVLLTMPLLQPQDAEWREAAVSVEAPGMQAYPKDERWKTVQGMAPPRGVDNARHFVTNQTDPAQFAFTVARDGTRTLIPTRIEKAWYTLYFTGQGRRDRLVMRITSSEPVLRLELPEQFEEPVLAAVNESPTKVTLDGRVLEIPLAGDTAQPGQLVEVHYQVRQSLIPGSQEIQVAKVQGDPWLRRAYWQLILPETQHLLLGQTPAVTSEFRWRFKGTHWGRDPLLDHAQLAAWTGKTVDEVPPSGNEYLFSASEPVNRLRFVAAPRSWIVAAASGALLLIGLLLLYVPVFRRPGFLLAAAVGLAATATMYPHTAVVLAQAAALGLLLAVVAGLLKRLFTTDVEVGRAVGAPASAISERGSTQPEYEFMPVDDGETSTMAAAPVPVASESQR